MILCALLIPTRPYRVHARTSWRYEDHPQVRWKRCNGSVRQARESISIIVLTPPRYAPIHPPDTLDKYLDKKHHLGEVDMKTVSHEEEEQSPEEKERQERIKAMPILEQCYNLMDFESVARRVMKKSAWAYYSSGADDEIVSPSQTPSN